jgi:hypothetical protein
VPLMVDGSGDVPSPRSGIGELDHDGPLCLERGHAVL